MKNFSPNGFLNTPELGNYPRSGSTVKDSTDSSMEPWSVVTTSLSVARKVEQKVAKFYQKVAKKVAKPENWFKQVPNLF